MLNKDNTGLLIVDIQGTLSDLVHESAATFEQVKTLIKGVQLMGIPVICMEQVPEKLGNTRPDILELLSSKPLIKKTFSGMQTTHIQQAIQNSKRNQWLVVGLEAHVCVYQTVCDLLRSRYEAHLVVDGISSRNASNKELAIRKMEKMGAHLTSVEMALFELQKVAEGDTFRELIKLIK